VIVAAGALQLIAALTLQDSALVARAHDYPDSVRESIRTSLASDLAGAERFAHAYAIAWRDSFWVREVARFAAWPDSTRRTRLAADSLRRAGNAALGRAGVGAALRLWRASLRRCESIADSACSGAVLGNIGAGFYQGGDLDSATSYFARARAIAARVGDYRTEGNAVGALASVASDQGELQKAAELYARAAQLRLLTGDERGAAADKNNLGLIAQSLGDLDGARQAFADALTANRRAHRAEPTAVNLINLGNLASLTGDYAAANDHYREALALYRSTGNTVKTASALHDLGLLNLDRGDYRAALENLTSALARYQRTGAVADIIAVRRDIAAAQAAMGNLQGALRALESAERLAQSRRENRNEAVTLALTRADLELDFNDFTAAARGYTRAELLARQANDPRARADAHRGQGALLLEREDYAGARAQFVAALHADAIAGDKRSAALTRLLLGYTDARRGDPAAARRTLVQSLDTLAAIGDSGGQAAALAALGDLAIQQGLPVVAESLYRLGLARLGSAPAPTVSWQLHAALADALRRQGGLDGAAQEYRAAVRDIARASGTLRREDRRAGFAADKWDVYAQFARVELARGRADSAFEISEQLRARQLLELLSRGRVTPWQTNPANAAQVAQEQDFRHQITVLMRRLEGPSTGLRGPLASDSATASVREALARVQQAYGDLLRQVQSDQPEYAGLVTAATAAARDVRAALPRDAALLEYLVSDSASLVFVATADTVAAVELGAGRNELAKLVEFSRSMLARPSPTSPTVWRAPLRRLYRYLIEPVESSGLLAGKQTLLIAPHAELHYVPFAALLGGGPEQYLVDRYRLTTIPSASVWLRLRRRGAPAAGGVLALAPQAAALPGSGAEVAAIQRVYGNRARVLTGNDASKRALRAGAPDQRIIHLATYGVLNKDNPLFSFVELTPSSGDDGRLEVHEVFGLDLQARLVVLSACRTALGSGTLADVPPGDDWLGLVEAFHFAGAARVMATLWPVEDRATADLMAEFYAGLVAGQSEPDALAEAQRAMLRKNVTAHPFYWAGFILSGDR